MRLYSYLNERSYTQKDLPDNFYVVFELEEMFDELKSGKIQGLKGISDKEEIQFQFLGVARDAMLVIDSKDLLKNNKVTRIMYDNPHYLVSDGMWALRRIFDAKGSMWADQVMSNVFSYMLKAMKDSGNKKYKDMYMDAEYHGIQNIHKEGRNIFENVNSLRDFAKAVQKYVENVFVEKLRNKSFGVPNHPGYELDVKDYSEVLYNALRTIGKIYSDEGEWVVKNDVFIVPKNSTLYVLWPSKLNQEALDYLKDKDLSKKDELLSGLIDNNIIDQTDVISWDMGKYSSHKKMVSVQRMLDELDRYNIVKLDKEEFEKKRSEHHKNK